MQHSRERMSLEYDELDTPVGRLTVIVDEAGQLRLVGWHEGHARMARSLELVTHGSGYALAPEPRPSVASRALAAYFQGDLHAIDGLPVAGLGTAFQTQVWRALRSIPCGETISYAELARRIQNPAAVRAVGRANGANPVGIVVPCHRVIGADGTLTGYGGGIERKRWLLEHERALRAPLLPNLSLS
jgi:methylated-DNA-[protein]-cysteine S-methyltransferase